MIKFIPVVAIAALSLAACGDADTASTADMDDGVVVTVNGVQGTGTVYVALQSEGIFGGNSATYGATATGSGSVDVMIADVDAGDYAIAAFQDTNGNGELDMAGGVPTEPWALSNGAGTTGAPSFGDAMMSFDGMDRKTITLNN